MGWQASRLPVSFSSLEVLCILLGFLMGCFAEYRIEIINSPSVPAYIMSEYRVNLKVLVDGEGFVTLLYMEINSKIVNVI